MDSHKDAWEMLKDTSRTFYIPITHLPSGLREAVASTYLCMRAIDQIEDAPELDNSLKVKLLRNISLKFQTEVDGSTLNDFSKAFSPYQDQLEEVTTRIGEWALLAPKAIAPRIWDATAAMSERMAHWVSNQWQIETEADLNGYTYTVAASVGLLLSDLWAWYDGTQTNRVEALGFGRCLQAINILRNHTEDIARGVDFFPNGWNEEDMQMYARRNLDMTEAYIKSLPPGPALEFCQIILTLSAHTLDALARGEHKLSRSTVIALVEQVTGRKK